MKKTITILSFITLFSINNAFSQAEKGQVLLGLNANNLTYNTNASALSVQLTPQIGSFVSDNIAIGGALGLQYSSANLFSQMLVFVGPFARFYAGQSNVRFFFEPNAGITGGSGFNASPTIGASIGLTFFASESTGIDLGFGASNIFASNGFSSVSITNIGLTLGLTGFLGGK